MEVVLANTSKSIFLPGSCVDLEYFEIVHVLTIKLEMYGIFSTKETRHTFFCLQLKIDNSQLQHPFAS